VNLFDSASSSAGVFAVIGTILGGIVVYLWLCCDSTYVSNIEYSFFLSAIFCGLPSALVGALVALFNAKLQRSQNAKLQSSQKENNE
jgi:hypothetical protein